ncbi:Prenylated Rab acceptor protein 1 [Microbotryomycetes sp. JL221]|nr:Prenylated Rab acceptor protein 1 [Microbotryomycetes sp. JL221]
MPRPDQQVCAATPARVGEMPRPVIDRQVQAAPFFTKRQQDAVDPTDKHSNYETQVQIHESCNPAQTNFLRNGLNDMVTLAKHAHDRIMRYGENDDLYKLYFGGNASSAAASGFYANIVWGNKPGVLLRCDNPDGNCEQTTAAGPWAGHWRGDNATLETVICPPTYSVRYQLSSLCWDGHEIGNGIASQWLATDLMHRMTHIPSIHYDHVHHFADSYPDVLALAASNSTDTVYNQNSFQFYAIDAYARDVAYPPNGCVAKNATESTTDSGHSHGSSSHSASSTILPSSTVNTIESQVASKTAAASSPCHTHEDGVVHCGSH